LGTSGLATSVPSFTGAVLARYWFRKNALLAAKIAGLPACGAASFL